MENKNNIILALIITAIGITTTVIVKKIRPKKISGSSLKIGILQTASHPALDAARDGFIDTIKNRTGDAITCMIYNAQGSITNAHAIAERFHADPNIVAIYAIATPALHAIASIEKKKPIFIAAVTNPHALGFITKDTNICGTTDMIDIPGTINAIKNIFPNISTIALVYNPAESNSVMQIKIMDKELEKHSIKTIHIGISTEADIPQAITTALSTSDALFAPTDNLIASAMPIIGQLAQQAQKPLIASHNQAVEQGALMARGIDYYESGKQTGEVALSVLQAGKKPSNLPIVAAKSDTIVINKQLLDQLGLTIIGISDKIRFINSNK